MQAPLTSAHGIDYNKLILTGWSEEAAAFMCAADKDGFFKIVYNTTGPQPEILLVPPFNGLTETQYIKTGYLMAFRREYIEEDDKEYALDVFYLFNDQADVHKLTVNEELAAHLGLLHQAIEQEYKSPVGTYLIIKALVKAYLANLIRYTRPKFLNQDVNQKRVYEFFLLLDEFFARERTVAFYARRMKLSEKRLNPGIERKDW